MSTWTVMLYLAGADDLEPYMARTLANLEAEGPPPGVEVIVQLARAPFSLLQEILPGRQPTGIDGDWSGVRRYRLRARRPGVEAQHYASELLMEVEPEDLGDSGSIVDPGAVADFVQYGMSQFPADRTALILSGHGMGFIGMMLDLMGKRPRLMPMRGLALALRQRERPPDLLLLDACRMNSLEIACQLALPRPAARWLLTPTIQSPRQGPDYLPLLQTLADHHHLPTEQVAAHAALALEPSAKASVIAMELEPLKWRAVAAAAREAGGPASEVLLAAAATCVHPTDLSQIGFLMHQPDASNIPVRYGELYRRLRFARLSGLGQKMAVANRVGPLPSSLGPLSVPFPLMLDWLTVLRKDLSFQQAAEILQSLDWLNDGWA